MLETQVKHFNNGCIIGDNSNVRNYESQFNTDIGIEDKLARISLSSLAHKNNGLHLHILRRVDNIKVN